MAVRSRSLERADRDAHHALRLRPARSHLPVRLKPLAPESGTLRSRKVLLHSRPRDAGTRDSNSGKSQQNRSTPLLRRALLRVPRGEARQWPRQRRRSVRPRGRQPRQGLRTQRPFLAKLPRLCRPDELLAPAPATSADISRSTLQVTESADILREVRTAARVLPLRDG